MEAMKTRDDVGGPVDAQFKALAVIAKVGGASEDCTGPFGGECGASFGF